jgi:phospholipase/carboxylesterase
MIFLHGLGDNADGFLTIFESNEFELPENCRIVLPCARKAEVTYHDKKEMNSWFDILSLDPADQRNLEDTRKCFNQE